MTNIITATVKGGALSVPEMDSNLNELDVRTKAGWKDLVSILDIVDVPDPYKPVKAPFGPSGLRRELVFDVGDYAFCHPFHVNHDVKVGGKGLIHVHWSTNGTNIQPVKWEVQVSRALGHNQAYFTAETSYFIQQAASGGAWRHMITEMDITDALTLTEPDELILVTLRRVTNGATENTDSVFGLICDMHYESDRAASPQRAPNFYV